ncbi:hypothetical protein BK004_01650 [bacterium CG10_46_32]|nr:MAG: hypothetical protein BK004_01650 [bacterium CG10_46_32]PIR56288.1 MAG: hypothetical protein COU73_01670 [Parcubacteria group bacterium CG10_big_fil_rev_8_21_14_0_10_46_32]
MNGAVDTSPHITHAVIERILDLLEQACRNFVMWHVDAPAMHEGADDQAVRQEWIKGHQLKYEYGITLLCLCLSGVIIADAAEREYVAGRVALILNSLHACNIGHHMLEKLTEELLPGPLQDAQPDGAQ